MTIFSSDGQVYDNEFAFNEGIVRKNDQNQPSEAPKTGQNGGKIIPIIGQNDPISEVKTSANGFPLPAQDLIVPPPKSPVDSPVLRDAVGSLIPTYDLISKAIHQGIHSLTAEDYTKAGLDVGAAIMAPEAKVGEEAISGLRAAMQTVAKRNLEMKKPMSFLNTKEGVLGDILQDHPSFADNPELKNIPVVYKYDPADKSPVSVDTTTQIESTQVPVGEGGPKFAGRITPRQLSSEHVQEMMDMRDAGATYQSIADKYNMSLFSVHRTLKEGGPPAPRFRRFTDEHIQDMKDRMDAGESVRSIAKSYGTVPGTVSKLARDILYRDAPVAEEVPMLYTNKNTLKYVPQITVNLANQTPKDIITSLSALVPKLK